MTYRAIIAQFEALVDFLEQNSSLALGLLRTALGKQDLKRKWAELAVQLNALEGIIKDGPGWAKYWAEKKCHLKRLCAQHAASVRQTGGGSGERFMLSELDTRLVAAMGGTSFVTGDSGIAVNPFPQTQLAVQSVSPPPPPSTAGTSLEETPAELTEATAAANARRRPRRLLCRKINSEMDRMAAIEERRVEAERMSAVALANLTEALEHITQAISKVASALMLIANNSSH